MPYSVTSGLSPLPSYLNLQGGDQLPPQFFANMTVDPATQVPGTAVNPMWFQYGIGNGMQAEADRLGVTRPFPKNLLNPNYGGAVPSTATRSGLGGNPVIRNALQNLLTDASKNATGNIGSGVQVGTTRRNAQVASRTPDLYKNYDDTQTVQNQTLADFTDAYLKSRPTTKAALDQEQSAIGKVYGSGAGSLSDDLAAARRSRAAAIRSATQSALNRASRASNIARMNSGNSSYLDRALAQEYARIAAGAAGDEATQAHTDALALADRRAALAGSRGSLINRYLQDSFIPVDERYRLNNLGEADLSNIGQLENTNTIYDVTTPEERIARQLGLLDTISNLDTRLAPV